MSQAMMTSPRQRWKPRTGHYAPSRMGERGLNRWSPVGRPSMGAKNGGSEELGIAVLSALSVAGIWSAINPSYFTFRAFASKPEARARAREGIWIGLAAGTLLSGAIWFAFKDSLAAILSEVTTLGLFGLSMYAVASPPTDEIPAIQDQNQQQSALPTPGAPEPGP